MTFEFEDASGLRSQGAAFRSAQFRRRLSADVRNREVTLKPAITWGPGLGDIGATPSGGTFFTGSSIQPPQAIYHRRKAVRLKVDALSSQPAHEGEFRFGGIDDHYFIASAINTGYARIYPDDLRSQHRRSQQPDPIAVGVIEIPRPAAGRSLYVGPKQFDLLRVPILGPGHRLRHIFVMVVPLLSALKWRRLYRNYGWAIIALTILLNLMLFYPRHRSVVAMRKMQAIQPEMKAIQDRYAHLGDRSAKQKMNTEIMNLYRERGQPGKRLRADAAHDAGAAGVLQLAVDVDRVARRAVRCMDTRPVGPGPVS